ncbi:MAG: hypothetical protein SO101_01210 [Lachnospiraceae bacterium]|nr:hypothetical protein [Lachnospiraceae bacterium]
MEVIIMSFVNISAAVLGLVLVFGGPVGFLIKLCAAGNAPDSFMHILIRRILVSRALTNRTLTCEEMLYETPVKAVFEKTASEEAVSEKAGSGKRVSENKNGHSSERRVS